MADPRAVKFPLSDLNPDVKTATYIGVLERQNMLLNQQNLQYRALLEALTGETWEEIDTKLKKNDLMQVAANAFERNLARDLAEAQKMVETNMSAANENAEG